MSTVYDKPVRIQRQDEQTEAWADLWSLHANVNKATYKQGLTLAADADQYHARMVFKLRYIAALEEMRVKPQLYRIVYRGNVYHVADYDDYMEEHHEIKITGVLYE